MEQETLSLLLALPGDELTPSLLGDLAGAGIRVEPVQNLIHFTERLAAGGASVAAIDVSLLDKPWFDHLASWRLRGVGAPVIFILAPDFELEASPDALRGRYDFLVKPVRAAELMVRARSALDTDGQSSSNTLQQGDLVLHLRSKEVSLAGEHVELTAFEFKMLRYFMMRVGQVVSQTELSAYLYSSSEQPDSNTIEAYVSRLRRKIGAARIRTIRGMGYRFG